MKKILFVENRYATEVYSKVSNELRDAFDISFLVQNHRFSVPNAKNHIIPYPHENDLSFNTKYNELSKKDRGHNFFSSGNQHYSYYEEKILDILLKLEPDVVIGEATLFHELITIDICKRLNVRYISPNATRYPVGRLVFLKNDSLEVIPRLINNVERDNFDAEKTLHDINQRKVVPSYMVKKIGLKAFLNRKYRVFTSSVNVMLSRCFGEKYNTPSIGRKLYLSLKNINARQKWDSMEFGFEKALNEKVILLPLQMQPEGNLDVWGSDYSDQFALVEMLSDLFKDEPVTILVKPNPKSKYELSVRLIELIKARKNLIGIEHRSSMKEVLPKVDLVMSVTGTIIMECVFLEKPVVVFGSHQFSKLPGVYGFSHNQMLSDLKNHVLYGPYPLADHNEKLSVLVDVFNNSYDAVLWDPVNQPEYNSLSNYMRLSNAIREVVGESF